MSNFEYSEKEINHLFDRAKDLYATIKLSERFLSRLPERRTDALNTNFDVAKYSIIREEASKRLVELRNDFLSKFYRTTEGDLNVLFEEAERLANPDDAVPRNHNCKVKK